MTIQELASQMAEAFETRTRDNGDTFYVLKDGSPEWMQDACHAAHGVMMPDDWRYRFILDACEALQEADDPDDAEIETDIYTTDLTAWLHSRNDRVS